MRVVDKDTDNGPDVATTGALLAFRLSGVSSISGLWGRHAGRLARRATRMLISSCVRGDDLLVEARHGYFVVFAKGATLDDGKMIARRILAAAEETTVNLHEDVRHYIRLTNEGVTTIGRQDVERIFLAASMQTPARNNDNGAMSALTGLPETVLAAHHRPREQPLEIVSSAL